MKKQIVINMRVHIEISHILTAKTKLNQNNIEKKHLQGI